MPLKYIAAFLAKTKKACCDHISSYFGVGRNVGGHVYIRHFYQNYKCFIESLRSLQKILTLKMAQRSKRL